MPLTVGKRTGYPRNRLHFTQGIPAPLPHDPRTCWKNHRIGPFPVLQFTQVWLFLAYLQLYAGCFPHSGGGVNLAFIQDGAASGVWPRVLRRSARVAPIVVLDGGCGGARHAARGDDLVVCVSRADRPRPPLTPRWAYEPWVWEDDEHTVDATIALVDGYRERDIPLLAR